MKTVLSVISILLMHYNLFGQEKVKDYSINIYETRSSRTPYIFHQGLNSCISVENDVLFCGFPGITWLHAEKIEDSILSIRITTYNNFFGMTENDLDVVLSLLIFEGDTFLMGLENVGLLDGLFGNIVRTSEISFSELKEKTHSSLSCVLSKNDKYIVSTLVDLEFIVYFGEKAAIDCEDITVY